MDTTVETPQANSSPATDAPADSSTAVEVVAAPTPAGEKAQFDALVDKAQGTEPTKPEEAPPTETEVTEAEPTAEASKDEPAKVEDKATDPSVLSNVAFDKRPEWQALKTLPKEAADKIKPVFRKLMESENGLREKVKSLEPAQQAYQRLRASTGDEIGFNNAMQVIEQYANDPAASVPMLERLLADAKARGGLEISSADLKGKAAEIQKLVDDGILSDEQAKSQREVLLEAEKARAAKLQAENKIKATERQTVDRQTQELIDSRRAAIDAQGKIAWGKDPDFPKLQNRFIDRGTLALEERTAKEGGRWLTNDEVSETLLEAWKQVKEETLALLPKPKATRAVLNTGSSRTSSGPPKNEYERFLQTVEAAEARK